VPRAALSAARGIEVIDLLAGFPNRAFNLSEIRKAAKINIASCHAVLSVLVERGYLTRCPKQKTYMLGPALVASGMAALKNQPLIARAEQAAEELRRDLRVPVLLSTMVGDDVVGVISLPDAAGRDLGLRVGQRIPVLPPSGAPFMAWAPEEVIDNWIARITSLKDSQFADDWRRALASIRKCGFQVTLREEDKSAVALLMAEMASNASMLEHKERLIELLRSLGRSPSHPSEIVPTALYDVALIASPIFDENGSAIFNLCVGAGPDKITGETVLAYADRLANTCLKIMRAHRLR
jgi:DNA-binding IclR family transcriptional regulator